MSEERRMILQMLKDGTVSVEEAERLLEAIPTEDAPPPKERSLAPTAQPVPLAPRRLVVLVTEGNTTKVNVKIPFSLVRAGLKLGKSFSSVAAKAAFTTPEDAAILEMLRDIDVDELLSSINDGEITLPYTMVDVSDEQKGEYVQLILE